MPHTNDTIDTDSNPDTESDDATAPPADTTVTSAAQSIRDRAPVSRRRFISGAALLGTGAVSYEFLTLQQAALDFEVDPPTADAEATHTAIIHLDTDISTPAQINIAYVTTIAGRDITNYILDQFIPDFLKTGANASEATVNVGLDEGGTLDGAEVDRQLDAPVDFTMDDLVGIGLTEPVNAGDKLVVMLDGVFNPPEQGDYTVVANIQAGGETAFEASTEFSITEEPVGGPDTIQDPNRGEVLLLDPDTQLTSGFGPIEQGNWYAFDAAEGADIFIQINPSGQMNAHLETSAGNVLDTGDTLGGRLTLGATAPTDDRYFIRTEKHPAVPFAPFDYRLEVTVEEDEEVAAIAFTDQTTAGDTVTVDEARVPDGGFVAIFDEDDMLRGHSDFLSAGTHTDLEIALDDPFADTQTASATAYQDTTGTEAFDPDNDEPYLVDDAPVTESATITIEEVFHELTVTVVDEEENAIEGAQVAVSGPEFGDEELETDADGVAVFEVSEDNLTITATADGYETVEEPLTVTADESIQLTLEEVDEDADAAVTFADQTTAGESVVVEAATLPDGGFLSIQDETGAVLGHTDFLAAGDHDTTTVTLDEPLDEDATLFAAAHRDTNDNEAFDYLDTSDEDGPYLIDDEPVTDSATVTLEDEDADAFDLTVTVETEDETSVPDANVTLGGADFNAEMSTDDDGVAVFENVPGPADYTITVTADGYEDVEERVALEEDTELVVTLIEPLDPQEPVLEYSDLSVEPSSGTAPLSVFVSVTAENIGDEDGEFDVPLVVDGEEVAMATATVAAGDTTTISFEHEFGEAGEYTVGIDDHAPLTVQVLPPEEEDPAPEYSNLDVRPTSGDAPLTIRVSATVENVGGDGDIRAQLIVNGDTVASQVVTLARNESTTVEFQHELTAAGTYEVTVNGLPAQTICVT